MHARRRCWGALAGVAVLPLLASPANGAVAHTVQPGETLWSIAAANNFTTRTIAAFNGLSEDSYVVLGETIQIPSESEGATALQSAGLGSSAGASGSTTSGSGGTSSSNGNGCSPGFDPKAIVSAPGMAHVPSPWGELHLAPAAADAWNAMRQEALDAYGVDIYPNGPLSAYRTYDQQAYLSCLFEKGKGAPANPPGTSSHETGNAIDLATQEMRTVVDAIGWKYGWTKVHAPGEWWHVDYVGR